VGGKANGLYRLQEAGLEVPAGFVVTTDAFFEAVERVIAQVADVHELREALLEVELPDGLLEEIRKNLEIVGAARWAVRSSAIGEDGERSFAGQQFTVLGAKGLDDVVAAIREVWASLYDPAALVYRSRLKVDEIPTGMAVVIEEMLDPSSAGVLFTRNPVDGAQHQAVISAAHGLGTTVVGGEECDTYYIERPSGYLVRSDLMGDEPILDEKTVAEFARVSEQVERIFSAPMDVEWAFAEGAAEDGEFEFYVLQARPISTALVPERDRETSVWTNTNVGEALPGVATPLTWSILEAFSRRGFEQAFGTLGLDVPEDYELVGSFYGRVYLNLTDFVSIASAIPVLSPTRLFEVAGGGGVELLEEVAREQRSPAKFISRLPRTIPKIAAAQASMPVVAPLWDGYFRVRCEEFFLKDLYRLNHQALKDELDQLDRLFDRTGLVMLTVSSNFLMSYMLTTESLRWFGTRETIGSERELFKALDVTSAEPGRALLEMGRIVRRSRRLRRIISQNPAGDVMKLLHENQHFSDVEHLLDEIEAFRREFGHRAPREAELATPRWREDLSFVFDVLKGFIDTRHLPSPREVERERQEAIDDIEHIIGRAFDPWTGLVFRGILTLARSNARRRETLRARVVDSLDMYRHFFLECGRRMTQTGTIREVEDVFYLKIDEIRDYLEDVVHGKPYRLRVIVRKAIHDAFEAQPDPPATFLLRGSEIIAERDLVEKRRPIQGNYTEVHGLPASGGRVTGRARVITDPNSGDTVLPGEVLVVPYADVGWTPLFIAASAVVMALGGPLSHASIVAREFQMPAVVNASDALAEIETGDIVTVDGDRGVVYVRKGDS